MEKQIYHLQIMSLRNHCFFHCFSQCFFHGFPYLGLSQVAVTPQGLDTDLGPRFTPGNGLTWSIDPQVLGIFVVSIMGILWDTLQLLTPYFFIFWRTLWRSAGFGGTLPLFYSIKIHKNPIIPWEDPHWHQQQALFSSARFGLKALLGAGFSAPPLGQWSRPGRVPWLLARSQLLRHELWTTFLANLVKLIQIEDLFFVGFTVPYSHPANNGFCSRIGCGTHALQVREKHSSLSIRLHYENPASTPQNCQTEGSWNGFSWYYILYIIAIIAIKWIFLGKSPTDLMQNMGANFPPDL